MSVRVCLFVRACLGLNGGLQRPCTTPACLVRSSNRCVPLCVCLSASVCLCLSVPLCIPASLTRVFVRRSRSWTRASPRTLAAVSPFSLSRSLSVSSAASRCLSHFLSLSRCLSVLIVVKEKSEWGYGQRGSGGLEGRHDVTGSGGYDQVCFVFERSRVFVCACVFGSASLCLFRVIHC